MPSFSGVPRKDWVFTAPRTPVASLAGRNVAVVGGTGGRVGDGHTRAALRLVPRSPEQTSYIASLLCGVDERLRLARNDEIGGFRNGQENLDR